MKKLVVAMLIIAVLAVGGVVVYRHVAGVPEAIAGTLETVANVITSGEVGKKAEETDFLHGEITRAIAALKEFWRTDVYGERTFISGSTGRFEVTDVQVIQLKDDFDASQIPDKTYYAMLDGARQIIEFSLKTNYALPAPICMNSHIYDTIIIYNDGSMKVSKNSPMIGLQNEYPGFNFQSMIEDVQSFESQYDESYDLITDIEKLGVVSVAQALSGLEK